MNLGYLTWKRSLDNYIEHLTWRASSGNYFGDRLRNMTLENELGIATPGSYVDN